MKFSSSIPDLPHDKKYHLFVCYERNSLSIVEDIVNNLEQQGVVCCYYERDFIPGRSITDNMYEAIGESMNMLVVLSEDLQNSHYCLDEIDKAFNLRVHGNYNLIPIRIEPCSIPKCLQHLVYVDVEEAVDTAHSKIIDAMVKKEQQVALKEDTNGEYCAFKLEAYRPNRLSFTRYRLKFTDRERASLWKKEFEVSAELLQEVEDTINASYFIRLQHIINHQYLLITIVYMNLLILIMIIFFALFLTSERQKSDKLTSAELCLAAGLPTWFILFMPTYVFCAYCECKLKGLYGVNVKLRSILTETLWEISQQNREQTRVIFLLYVNPFDTRDIKLCVMKMNFKPCEQYFERQLEKENKAYLTKYLKEDESHMDYTSRLFNDYLKFGCVNLLEISTTRRHNMNNSAKCVCLLVDDWLKSLSIKS